MYLRALISSLTSLLFPEYCVGCTVEGTLLCPLCLAKVPKAEDPPLTNIFSVFQYQDPRMKAAVRLLKYKNSKPLGAILGNALHGHLLEILSDEMLFDGTSAENPWIVIPIPLSQERLRTRGYNQAELIGQSLVDCSSQLFILDSDILYKRRHTESQVSIKDRKSRLSNPQGSFGIRNDDRIYKRNCIVLDDVVTTGATIREAMRTLRKAGARKVLGLSVAH